MKTSILALLLIFFGSVSLYAQDTTWFNSRWKECPADEAMYYHLESTTGGVTSYRDYYLSNNQLQNTGQYLNDKKHGESVWYHKNGQKSYQVSYVNGMEQGNYMRWHPNGVVEEKGEYRAGKKMPGYELFNEEGEVVVYDAIVWDVEDTEANVEDAVEILEDDSQSGEPDPNAFMLVEELPVVLNKDEVAKAIGYHPMAREAEIQGKVFVRILVDKDGSYVRSIVTRDVHPLLTKSVTKNIDRLKFSPGVMGGRPTKMWSTHSFNFSLDESVPKIK